jgi:hypothetical protein
MARYDDGGGAGGTGALPRTQQDRVSNLNDAIDKARAQGGSGSTRKVANPKDPLVYLGQMEAPGMAGSSGYYQYLASGGKPKVADQTATLSEVANQYYNWDQKTKDKFLSQLALTGRDVTGLADAQIAALWGAYAQQAGAYYGAGQKLTPWDILAKDMRQREAFMRTPRTETATATDIQTSTSEDAHAIFLQAAQSLLGRDPTKSEIKTFQSALNAYEKANPRITKTTSNYLGDQLQSQSQTTEGGVSAEARGILAMEDIKKDPEYGAHQAATNGMNWLMEMVQGG